MNRAYLIETAAALKQPGFYAREAYTNASEKLASEVSQRMLARPDLEKLIGGSENLEMMLDNHRNHARFFSSLFDHYFPEVLVDTVIWVFSAYRSHGFNLTYWPAQLDIWVDALKTNLTQEAFNEIYPFYHWMIVNNPVFAALSEKT
ncbi:MAG: hypothetical protein LWX09_05595 [Bacteroidia bacterium]|jgi:hypothetical protein|nr:hypothetical protein [Bacteroidia bacterium]